MKGSCEWFVKSAQYTTWLSAPTSQLLWVKGPPGIGKTVMSLYLSEVLTQVTQKDESSLLLYFFCDYQDNRKNTTTAIIRGLIYQIIDREPELVKYMLRDFELYKDHLGIFHPQHKDVLWRNFVDLLSRMKSAQIYCVLDGLDECDRTMLEWFIGKLNTLESRSQPICKTILTSRELSEQLQNMLARGLVANLDPELNKNVESDLKNFIATSVMNLAGQMGYSDPLKARVQRALLEEADGTFLWAACAIKNLRDTPTSEVDRALQQLPKQINGHYQRMLLQIEPSRREIAAQILVWVATAMRPLTLDELAAATRADNIDGLSPVQVMRDRVKFCGSMLKLVGREIHFIHRTAKAYLLQLTADKSSALNTFHVSPLEAHRNIALTCLKYLRNGALAKGSIDLRENDIHSGSVHRRKQYPFLDYSARYWPEHVRLASTCTDELYELLNTLYNRQPRIWNAWLQTYWTSSVRKYETPENFSLTHLAAFSGIDEILKLILEEHRPKKGKVPRSFVDKESSHKMTALHWASRNGNRTTIEILLNHGADIKARGFFLNPICWAARNGHVDAVKALLKRGADREEKNGGMSPLQWAAWEGKDYVVEMLLDNYAEPDSQTSPGVARLLSFFRSVLRDGNELPWATFADAKKVNQAIERIEAEQNAKLMINWHLLMAADLVITFMVSCFLDIILFSFKYELARNGMWLAQRVGTMYGQDVSWAILTKRGRLRFVIDVVLQPQVSFSHTLATIRAWPLFAMVSVCGVTILAMYATFTSQLILAAILVTCDFAVFWIFVLSEYILGIEVPREIILCVASRGWLLDPWPGFVTWKWRTCTSIYLLILLCACRAGYVGTAMHISIGSQDIWFLGAAFIARRAARLVGHTALHLAASRGHVNIVEHLVRMGADATIKDSDGITPLETAMKNGHRQCARVLLAHEGAKHTPISWELPGFHLAALCGHLHILEQFITQGEDPDQLCPDGLCAVHYASSVGNVKIIAFLKRKDSIERVSVPGGLTSLHFAARNGQEDACKYLMDNGIAVDAVDKDGVTPLAAAARHGYLGVVRFLVEVGGANVNLPDFHGYLPLHRAARGGHSSIVEFLTGKQHDLRRVTKYGSTALSLAAEMGHIDTVKLLLGKDVGIDVSDQRGHGPLHLAVAGAHDLVIRELLLANRAAVDQASLDGTTPLHIAVYRPVESIVSLLLESGANPNAVDRYGRSPYHWALEYPLLASEMESLSDKLEPPDEDVRRLKLRDVTSVNVAKLLEKGLISRDPAEFSWLGMCLMQLQAWDHARKAYQYTLGDDMIFQGLTCDGCNNTTVNELLFVCRTCHDLALCDSCMTQYKRKTLAPYLCNNHDFITISADGVQVKSQEPDDPYWRGQDEWLGQLSKDLMVENAMPRIEPI